VTPAPSEGRTTDQARARAPSDAPAAAAPPAPPQAHALFGDRLPHLQAYADLLAGPGTAWGLLGPRERPRLWPRHILNCAAVETLVPPNVRLLDVGSGAGLPGLVLALVRPDLHVVLLDSLARRVTFLERAVEELGVGARVCVVRARAEDLAGEHAYQVVAARAVAPLGRLAGWCMPLVAPGGELLALRGEGASRELAADAGALRVAGVRDHAVVRCGVGVLDEPTTVVRLRGA